MKIRVSLVRSRVEAPSFKPLQRCEGFFVLDVLSVVNTSDSKSVASDSVAVQVRPLVPSSSKEEDTETDF